MIQLSSSSSAISSGLTWSKIPRSRDYELRLNGKAVGRLRRPGWFSSSFVAETPDGAWTFRRSGCLGSGAQILDSSSQQQIATFKSKWGRGGTLTFADGQTFQLSCKGWWRPIWSVVEENDQPVLHIHRRERIVEVPPRMAAPSRLPLLIMFTWYRVLQAEEDTASAAMVVAVIG